MPGLNGTGPRGMGPMTGGARGLCTRYQPIYGSYGNPWFGRGLEIGWSYPRYPYQPYYSLYGRGYGYGIGYGYPYPRYPYMGFRYGYGLGMRRGWGWRVRKGRW